MEPQVDPRRVVEQMRKDLRKLMKVRKMSQNELAREMKVTKGYVSQMMTGKKELTLVFVAHALAVLHAHVNLVADSHEDWAFAETPDLGR